MQQSEHTNKRGARSTVLEKIAKLLAKAEAATTQAEAEVYFAKAQELATLHQISLAEAHLAKGKSTSVLTNRTITVGERGKQVNSHLVWLFDVIARANDVRINIAHNSTFVIAFGFSDDIDTVELMWSRIAPTMIRLGEEYLATGEWRDEVVYRAKKVKTGERVYSWRSYDYVDEYAEVWGYYPVTKQAARASFYRGFQGALSNRLQEQRRQTVEQADKAAEEYIGSDGDEAPVGASLVLAQKRDSISTYYKKTSTARGSYKGGQVSHTSSGARAAGCRAGQTVSLGNTSGIGGKRGSLSA